LLGSKAIDLCNPEDPICHAGPGNEWSGHTEGYVPAYTNEAAAFVASKLMVGSSPQTPGYGPQSPAYAPQSPGYGPLAPGPGPQAPGSGPSVPGDVPAPGTPVTPNPQAPLV
jgi:cutinase